MQRRLLVTSRSILEHKFATIARRATVVQFERTNRSGMLGRTDNCQVGVCAGYASVHGHSLVDCRLYLTEGWLKDPAKGRVPALVCDYGTDTAGNATFSRRRPPLYTGCLDGEYL